MPEAALRHEPAAAGHQRAGSPGGTSAPKQGPQPDGQDGNAPGGSAKPNDPSGEKQ